MHPLLNTITNHYNHFNNYNWKLLTNFIPDQHELKEILNNTLPFTILLPSKVGRAVHSLLSVGKAFQTATQIPESPLWTTGKLFLQFFEVYVHSSKHQKGILVHTALGFTHQIYDITQDRTELTQKILSVVSTALYLASFLNVSKKNSLLLLSATAFFQAGTCFYYMIQAGKEIAQKREWKNIKLLTLISQGALGAIHLTRAYGCFQEFQRIQQVAGQIFILMRHADRTHKEKDPSITDQGKQRAANAADAIHEIAQQNGKKEIVLVVSSLKRSQETGECIQQALQEKYSFPSTIQQDARTHERENNCPLSRKEKKAHPDYQNHQKLTEKEQFGTRPLSSIESGYEQFTRMREGITSILDTHQGPDKLVVFISHSIAMKNFFKGLLYENRLNLQADFHIRGVKNCEICLMEKIGTLFAGIQRLRVELSRPERIANQVA